MFFRFYDEGRFFWKLIEKALFYFLVILVNFLRNQEFFFSNCWTFFIIQYIEMYEGL